MDWNTIWNGLITNGFYDIIKIVFWWLLWWLWCKYKNNLKIKWNKNKVFQKWWKNKAKLDWNSNDVTQI